VRLMSILTMLLMIVGFLGLFTVIALVSANNNLKLEFSDRTIEILVVLSFALCMIGFALDLIWSS
jgi:hypothetical protein